MRILSWNCLNGFDNGKPEFIFKKFTKTDIFIIQECKRVDVFALRKNKSYKWKFINWYGDDYDDKSDLGIAVISKNYDIKFTEQFNRNFRYVVPYTIITNKEPITLFIVWTKSSKRGEFNYDENVVNAINFKEYKKYLNNLIIIGDFNTGYTMNHKERYKKLYDNLKAKNIVNYCHYEPDKFEMTYFFDKNKEKYLNDFCFASENINKKIINFTT